MNYQRIQSADELALVAPAFENASWEDCSPSVWQGICEAPARAAIRESLNTQLHRVYQTSEVQKFFDLCEVPGSQVEDYLNRAVKFFDHHHAVLAIRFKSQNLNTPFVELIAKDFAFTAANVSALLEVAREEFKLFKPKWLRVELRGEENPFWQEVNRSPDLRTFLGEIVALQKKEKPPRFDEIELIKCTDTSFYPQYKADYDEFNASAGVMADEVYPSSEADFQQLVDFGYTFRATIKGQWAGIIAFSEGRFLGVKTLVVHEELLTREFRGQGFGAALQRQAISRVEQGNYSLLVGTIHTNNTPSLRTAARIGRSDIGGFWFLEL